MITDSVNKAKKSGTEDLVYKILDRAIKRSFAGYTIHFKNKMNTFLKNIKFE
jgi:hypothetical protein